MNRTLCADRSANVTAHSGKCTSWLGPCPGMARSVRVRPPASSVTATVGQRAQDKASGLSSPQTCPSSAWRLVPRTLRGIGLGHAEASGPTRVRARGLNRLRRPDGRLFRSGNGNPIQPPTGWQVWQKIRAASLTSEQLASPADETSLRPSALRDHLAAQFRRPCHRGRRLGGPFRRDADAGSGTGRGLTRPLVPRPTTTPRRFNRAGRRSYVRPPASA
jgi:hypothetical protein